MLQKGWGLLRKRIFLLQILDAIVVTLVLVVFISILCILYLRLSHRGHDGGQAGMIHAQPHEP